MINFYKKCTFLLLMLILGLNSCGKSEDTAPVSENEPVNAPGAVTGTLPENGEACADIEAISGEPLKVSVSFQWTVSEFADNYDLRVFESQNEIYNKTYTSLEAGVELDRGKSYSWSITAKNGDGETISDTFSFTTPGEAVGNYVPYAAVITVAFKTTTTQMDVSWLGSDEDGDALTYDVSVKENEELLVEFAELSADSLNSIPFVPASSYEIEVTSKDSSGNFSISKHSEIAPE